MLKYKKCKFINNNGQYIVEKNGQKYIVGQKLWQELKAYEDDMEKRISEHGIVTLDPIVDYLTSDKLKHRDYPIRRGAQ